MDVKSYTLDEFANTFPNISIYSRIRQPTFRLGTVLTTAPLAAYSILFVIGIVGNSWVAAIIGRLVCHWMSGAAGMDTPTGSTATGSRGMHIYILSLCCFDLLCLICLPLLLMDLAYGQWTIPYSIVCKLFLSGDCLTKFGAPLLLTAVSGFCYFRICTGNRQNGAGFNIDLGNPKVAIWITALCLIAVVAFGAPIWLYGGINYLVATRNDTIILVIPKCIVQTTEQVMATFMGYSFAVGYIFPAALFTYFYSALLYHVHRHAKRIRGKKGRYFWRVAKTSMSLVIFYLSCWTPYWALFLYIHFAGRHASVMTNVVLSYFIHTLPYINCCGYPILYTILNRNIKDDYNRMARQSRERKEQCRQMQNAVPRNRHGCKNSRRETSYRSTGRSDSPDRSIDTMAIDRSPTSLLGGGVEDKELVLLK